MKNEYSFLVRAEQVAELANGEKSNLAELVSRMPSDYQVSEESFGQPVGKEEW